MLVYMGILSRLYRISHTWVNELQQCYDLIQPWHLTFASGYKAKEQHLKPDVDQVCLPSTFTKARQESLESWSGHTQIPGIMQSLVSLPEPKSKKKPTSDANLSHQNSSSSLASLNTTAVPAMMGGNGDEDDLFDLGEVIERV
ncbi:hypothetical protein BDB00DRAFT_808380 [Zychaea mexicana]|uniref:uncharacterized protein n=1 Tax=Zychaea mexicana TaxID=64656 RepID=UPI0022FDE639|nr:uncharacterized protein BDB00DRAFT_808380 [Zychaea mexicana]KAI9496694.1 hypothetical protein BDB00DRAFT_808380 [Zychaea mexicana]